MKTINQRNVSLDLLRVLSMIMVVFHHIIVHGEKLYSSIYICLNNKSLLFANSFFVIAVNCFFLASGYFRINLSIKKVLKISLYCILSILIWNIIIIFFEPVVVDASYFFLIFRRVISFFSCHWYILSYFILMMLSPFINKMIDTLNNKEILLLSLLLLVINVIYGFIYQYPEFGDGYCIQQAIMMYLFGSCISRKMVNVNRAFYFLGYIVLSLAVYYFSILVCKNNGNIEWFFQYNNPLLIGSSLCLFSFFESLKIDNVFLLIISKLSKYSIFIITVFDYPPSHTILWDTYEIIKKTINNKCMSMMIYSIALFALSIFVGKIIICISNIIERIMINEENRY